MQRRRIVIGPAHVVFAIALGAFGTLLVLAGWTWPLKAVALLLPVAGFSLFT